ncbi:type II secretion system protein GspM [Thauera sp. Sel9]|uniref:type II secretion system protein GspM n=1 Tax=Thauera sp. Sel9 TaxID=2974299 RepID=UPI0021E12158|nr:type II secretion system protein GspM [Thauera sp. Sel9]MCV2218105.1 type II secretion system protein GspM [Thauera sp. Sel9]
MTHLPLAVRRALAIVLGCVPLIMVWSLVIRPLHTLTTAAIERLDDSRFELQRLQLLAAGNDVLTPDEFARQSHEVAAWVFRSRTDSPAVLSAVDELVRGAGVELNELRAAEPHEQGPLTRFSVDLKVTAPETELVHLLTAFAHHRPLLTVDRAVILSSVSGPDSSLPPLSVELRVSGFGAEVLPPSPAEELDVQ